MRTLPRRRDARGRHRKPTQANEDYFAKNGEPLFSSHMLDLSEDPLEENIATCVEYLERMSKSNLLLEMELGITGGLISASRGAAVPSRRRRDSCSSDEVVGGFFFDFEAIRIELSEPRCSAQAPGGARDRRRGHAGRVRAPGQAPVRVVRDDRLGAEGVPRRPGPRALDLSLGGPHEVTSNTYLDLLASGGRAEPGERAHRGRGPAREDVVRKSRKKRTASWFGVTSSWFILD